jgi:general secretion pathway protein D
VSSEKYNYMRTEQLQMRQEDWPVTPRSLRPMLPEVHDFLASPPLDIAPKETGAPSPPPLKH